MKKRIFILILFIVSCTPVVQKSPPAFQTMFVGTIEAREDVVLDPNESKSARVVIGLLSGGIIGAIGTAQTEEGFSNPKAYKYHLLSEDGERKSVLSRSFVDKSSCVAVISPDETELEVLRKLDSMRCPASYNKAMHSTSE